MHENKKDRLTVEVGDLIYDKKYREHLLVIEKSINYTRWLVLETGKYDWDMNSQITTDEFEQA
jgi:hypothetical protein